VCARVACLVCSFGPSTFALDVNLVITLSKPARETLLAPAVVGAIFGLITGLLDFGVALEYPHMQPMYFGIHWPLLEALITFLLVFIGIVLVFGVIPLVVARAMAKRAAR
jgi:hypothetical protein